MFSVGGGKGKGKAHLVDTTGLRLLFWGWSTEEAGQRKHSSNFLLNSELAVKWESGKCERTSRTRVAMTLKKKL